MRWRQHNLIAVGLLLPCLLVVDWQPACEAKEPDSFQTVERRFQLKLEELHRAHGFPGATAAFVMPDGRVGTAAVGLADVEHKIPMTTETRMLAGSIGKTFVAAVALQLASEGKLNLDDKISTWLGEEKWFAKLPNGSDITLRHLLTHSSGLTDHVDSVEYANAIVQEAIVSGDPDFVFGPERLVSFALNKEPLFAAGEGYSYTDTGYILVGLIIEKVSGRSYYEEVGERFLKPLKLTLTSPSNTRKLPGLAPGYLAKDNPLGLPPKNAEAGTMHFHPGNEWTGGGLCSNPRDLARWAMSLYGGKQFEPRWQKELLGSKVPIGKSNKGFYGLGVFITESELGTVYGHTGWFPGWVSSMAYFSKPDIAVAVQVNRDFQASPDAYASELVKVVLESPR
ncbi:D-alanyl-D-alanine carboxypeptidase precursor [Symmachiella macrocystis]|uniref:D-alanyl-D-alanine carboxypeptidase n=1 Tax=Symmachiella macrocystis TaxID=2527985 RepID=A0A5C6BS40_9PLAN|nr:serine hydrolase domain-containing protein [Symmachiella macrocystis]TWU14542.1 D-alanyl-D-alanine carboxypeptidase precursor [Symmachiella macrocystis]